MILEHPWLKLRAQKAYLASQPLRVECRVPKGCWIDGWDDFAVASWVRRDCYPFSFSFLTLKGKTEYSVRMFWLWSRFLVSTWFLIQGVLCHLPSAKNLVHGVLWHHNYQKSVSLVSLHVVSAFLCFQILWLLWCMSNWSNTVPFCSSSGYSIFKWEQKETFLMFAENKSLINMCTDYFKGIG